MLLQMDLGNCSKGVINVKTIYKVFIELGIGICLIFVGVSMNGMNEISESKMIQFNGIGIEKESHRIHDTHFVAREMVSKIEINTHKANVYFVEKENIYNIEIEAKDIYNGFKISQDGSKLEIDQPHYWRWNSYNDANIYINLPIGYNLRDIEINVGAGYSKISGVKAHRVDINTGAGELVMKDLVCHDLDIDAGVGNTEIYDLNVQNNMDIDLGLGNIDIQLLGRQEDFNYKVNVGLGSVDIGHHHFSGITDQKMNNAFARQLIDVDCGLGSVNIEMEE